MRKYRGLTLATKQWVKGYYFKDEDKYYIIPDTATTFVATIMTKHFVLEGFVEVDPETVGQEIGIKDKNKKEIHGGFDNKGGDIVEHQGKRAKVMYFVCGFDANTDEDDNLLNYLGLPGHDIEIIGTMAEDSNLLEGE